MPEISKEALDAAYKLAEETKTDIFLYRADIDREPAQQFCCTVSKINPKRDKAALFLTTLGGDPDAAFLIARCLQRRYNKFSLFVCGPCKSAGTLIAIAACEIGMTDCGELGPLDIQLGKDDEIFKRSSGLDLSESIKYLRDLSWELFVYHFVKLKRGSSITTKTAAEIAQSLSLGVVNPIAEQIDPIRLGEVQRAMRIAKDYGVLLNPNFPSFDRLITHYPSHGFIIDREQAKGIFENVRPLNAAEFDLASKLADTVSEAASKNDEFIEFLSPTRVKTDIPIKAHETEPQTRTGGNGQTVPVAATTTEGPGR